MSEHIEIDRTILNSKELKELDSLMIKFIKDKKKPSEAFEALYEKNLIRGSSKLIIKDAK